MFVVCGEALMDVFAEGKGPTGMALDARMGGSPFNAAVGLARLGQLVGFFGPVSRDFLGERLMAGLRDEGVVTSITPRTDAPTTLSLIGTDAQGVPAYAFYGHGAADRQLVPEMLHQLPSHMSGLHIGSYTTVVEPTAGTLRALVDREHRRTPISYDPNVRLNVEPDLSRWRDTLQWMLPRTHLLKISLEDLQLLCPGSEPEHFAAKAVAAGVKLVVVTLGAEGAQAWSGAAGAQVPAQTAGVVDTVGAGDSFQAALVTWLMERGLLSIDALGRLERSQLQASLHFAAQAAAITCSRRGANPPRRDELPA